MGIQSGLLPYFPAFGLSTERYFVSLRIQSKCGKRWTRKTSNTDTFHAVLLSKFLKLQNQFLVKLCQISYYLTYLALGFTLHWGLLESNEYPCFFKYYSSFLFLIFFSCTIFMNLDLLQKINAGNVNSISRHPCSFIPNHVHTPLRSP